MTLRRALQFKRYAKFLQYNVVVYRASNLMTTLYEILEVSNKAADKEIKAWYFKLARKWHPDKNQGNELEANKRFKEIGYAYEILKNTNQREEYDIALKNEDTHVYTNYQHPTTRQNYTT